MRINFMGQYIINNKTTYDYEKINLFELRNSFTYNLKNSLEYIQNYRGELSINGRQRNGGRL